LKYEAWPRKPEKRQNGIEHVKVEKKCEAKETRAEEE
jgi:hypothetical protein